MSAFFRNLLGSSSSASPPVADSAKTTDTKWLQQRLATSKYANQPCQFRTATTGFVRERDGTWSYRTDLASNRGPCEGVRAEEQISNNHQPQPSSRDVGGIPNWVWFLGGVILLMYLTSRQPAAAMSAVMPSVGYIDDDNYGDIEDYPLSNGGSVNLMSSSRRTGSPAAASTQPQATASRPLKGDKKRAVRWKD